MIGWTVLGGAGPSTVDRMGTDEGAAGEYGSNEELKASKMSDGKNDAVQMNENVPVQPVIDKDSSFKTSALAITSIYVGASSWVVV